MLIDFISIVKNAWLAYDESRKIKSIIDISPKVSTNHVYKITLKDKSFVIAKLSYFGFFDHFVEDHSIINILSNNLPYPYEHLLSRSLMKGHKLFVYRHQGTLIDAWVVFYRPVKIKTLLPRRLEEDQIQKLAKQFAQFHKACYRIRNTLPASSKTLHSDVRHLLNILETEKGQFEHRKHLTTIKKQTDTFFAEMEKLNSDGFEKIPVFVDWNIGNFSVTSHNSFRLYSRWDYDWFRMSSRMLDFYFLSRVVSDVGDRTIFTYNIQPLMEPRFLLFLKTYHQIFPITPREIYLLKEVYRFFLLNYVIKDGRYFFNEIYANKLQKEVYEIHLPAINNFDPEKLLRELNL